MRISAHSAPPRGCARRRSLAGILALFCLALPALAASNGLPDRGDGASRISSRDAASEYWDLVARFESGHRLFARFLITNEGPGDLSAFAFGHVLFPDGRVLPFQNGRRRGRWELTDGGRRIRIASSVLDQTGPARKFEYDSNRRGVKIHLWFEPDGALSLPAEPALADYSVDLLDTAAPVHGTLWMKGMEEPLELKGTLAATHTWMERSESELVLRHIEFFSLEGYASFYLSDVTTPRGERSRWLVVRRGGEVLHRSDRFEFKLADGPKRSSDYPVPAALRVRSPAFEGEIRVGEVLLEHNPLEALPQPFRFLLSFKFRPRRIWTDSAFEARLKAGSDRPDLILKGAGITSLMFLKPLPAEMSGGSTRDLR